MIIQAYLAFFYQNLPFISITLLVWLTYFYTLSCGACSDDVAGILEYDGKLQGFQYGMIWRWLRYHVCGGNSPSKHKDRQGNAIPNGKVPSHHHFLSIVVFNITCLITYQALLPYLGPKIALMAILFLIVHPCTTQGVAWFSGLAYPLSLLWMSLIMILTRYFYFHPTIDTAAWLIPAFILLQWLAIHAIFATTAMLWTILLFLGYWQMAILSFIVSGAMCFDEIRKIVTLRVEEFKKQQMAQSTVLNWRKPIVALKTFFYYIRHAIAPIRMGLYHTWNFHYDESTERMDWMFLGGLASLVSLVYIFLNTNLIGIKLGILWFSVFLVGFSNLITAQQFVTERYVMVSCLGLGMIVATLTQNCIWAYTAIISGYLVRTWCHLPTYDNEYRFYQSNVWNFPKSEVALGNLGVTQVRMGLEASAKETWMTATIVNPNYDVPWVNIFYQLRTKGTLLINNGDYVGGINKFQEALPYLQKALAAKVCHFPDQWKREYTELANAIQNPNGILNQELDRLVKLRSQLKNLMLKCDTQKRAEEIQISIVNNDKQIENLINFIQTNGILDKTFTGNYFTDKLMEKLTRRPNDSSTATSS